MDSMKAATVRAGLDAFNRRDEAGLVECCAPDVEWIALRRRHEEPVPYRGHDGIRRALRDAERHFELLRNEPQRFLELGDTVVALGRIVYKWRAGKTRVDAPGAWLCWVRNGSILRMEGYPSPHEALEALEERPHPNSAAA